MWLLIHVSKRGPLCPAPEWHGSLVAHTCAPETGPWYSCIPVASAVYQLLICGPTRLLWRCRMWPFSLLISLERLASVFMAINGSVVNISDYTYLRVVKQMPCPLWCCLYLAVVAFLRLFVIQHFSNLGFSFRRSSLFVIRDGLELKICEVKYPLALILRELTSVCVHKPTWWPDDLFT